jgi:sugar O-acyltransferase (sialic acid O-acetyltransferase NeuD family)
MTGFIRHQKSYDTLDSVVFFGADGGCLDAYYLAQETYSIANKVILSDKKLDIPFDCVKGGGFYNICKYPGSYFVFQCGNVHNHQVRHNWYMKAIEVGAKPLTCISPLSYVHPTAKIGPGSIVYPGAKIMTNVNIGQNVVVLPNAVINHDCNIGDFSIINSSSVLNGGIKCGRNVYIGSNVTVKEQCSVSDYCTIGAGSLVLKDIFQQGVYFGSPVKKHKNAF